MHFYKGICATLGHCSNKWAPPLPPPPCREGGGGLGGSDVCVFVHPSHDLQTFDSVCVQPSHDLQTLLTMFVSIHLMTCTFDKASIHIMTCRHIWQCLCSPADMFDTMRMTVFVFIHFMTILLIITIGCVFVQPSHDLQTLLIVCSSISWPAHFWQCLCSSISCPADTFDNVCVHLSYDLLTLLTLFVSIHLMTCRHFWQCFCVHPSHDMQTVLTVGLTVTW